MSCKSAGQICFRRFREQNISIEVIRNIFFKMKKEEEKKEEEEQKKNFKLKPDGVGPVDNGPSTDQLHHIVQKQQKTREKKT